ncbi:hypothetical protein NEOLEDRAFT_1173610 [Neolentinus lepideus HHB14362 ss-1]|uniref:DUF6534 domain-containing protein n=1 Tax=Neolentinus lepideus HHB14362 ss-1 TaxID=1314782 RepID=A0A165MHY0_9AGAM|nr:hypothetical protein NEOLEDRAFT_1173610 [Neolentinus lepideus HHB14362 ss-1]
MVSLHLTFGACLNGTIVSLMLYGVTLGQVTKYFRTFKNDRLALKLTVTGSFMLDTFQQFLIIHSMWYYLVTRCNGNPDGFLYANWSYLGQVIPSELIFYIVQCFYILRIWSLSKRKLTWLLFVPATMEIMFSTVYTVQCYKVISFTVLAQNDKEHQILKGLLSAIVTCAIMTDMGIAISMSKLLLEAQKRYLLGTRSLINMIIRYTIATGSLVTFAMIMFLICVMALPGNMVFVGIYFNLGKLYVNSMLAALNGREAMRAQLGNIQVITNLEERSQYTR